MLKNDSRIRGAAKEGVVVPSPVFMKIAIVGLCALCIALLSRAQTVKEYVRLGGRVIALESYATTQISISPSPMVGTTVPLTAQFTDPSGAGDILGMGLLINSTFSGAGGCLFQIYGNQVTLFKADGSFDSQLQKNVPVSDSDNINNGNCKIVVPQAAVANGTMQSLGVTVTFLGQFATSAKTVFGFTQIANGAFEWETVSTWFPSSTVTVGSITPSSGSGAVQTFVGTYADMNGYQDLQWVQMLFAVAADGGGQTYCLVHYDVQGNRFWLYSDIQGYFVGPVAPGTSSNLLQGSLCALNTAGSSVTNISSGLQLAVSAKLVFKQAGARNVYMRAYTLEGVDTGWVQGGTWTAVAASLGPMAVAPSSGSVMNGTEQTFTLTYPDTPGFEGAAFGWAQFLVAVAANGGGQPYCQVHYDRAGNGLWMYSSDVGYFLGPVTPGTSSNTLTSSACSVNTASTTVQDFEGYLVLTVPITLKSPMVGSQKLFERELTVLNVDTGFVQTGTLNVN